MLFNSLAFVFGFLPVTLVGFLALARVRPRLSELWLVAASLFFYGWWNPKYLILLLASIAFNYSAGYAIAREVRKAGGNRGRAFLWAALAANLALLGYFKYANFFIETVNPLVGGALPF